MFLRNAKKSRLQRRVERHRAFELARPGYDGWGVQDALFFGAVQEVGAIPYEEKALVEDLSLSLGA
jgi:hypothetical protein